MRIGPLLAQLADLEGELAEDYRAGSERHVSDHDVHHLLHAFAQQCDGHVEKLAPHATRYGAMVDEGGGGGTVWGGVLERLRTGSEVVGAPPPAAGLLLLRDLRSLFLAAEECSITWVMAGQAAQAARDRELLELVTACHTETEIQVKWLTTRIKVAAPQALVTG